MVTTQDRPRARRWAALASRWLAGLLLLVVVACGAIAAALQVTPLQTVTVAGQLIRVGATGPHLSWSGPGEVDLFGQSLPTNIQFTGPVRRRVEALLRLGDRDRRGGHADPGGGARGLAPPWASNHDQATGRRAAD